MEELTSAGAVTDCARLWNWAHTAGGGQLFSILFIGRRYLCVCEWGTKEKSHYDRALSVFRRAQLGAPKEIESLEPGFSLTGLFIPLPALNSIQVSLDDIDCKLVIVYNGTKKKEVLPPNAQEGRKIFHSLHQLVAPDSSIQEAEFGVWDAVRLPSSLALLSTIGAILLYILLAPESNSGAFAKLLSVGLRFLAAGISLLVAGGMIILVVARLRKRPKYSVFAALGRAFGPGASSEEAG